MGADSKISWTDHTFNPWMGCTKVSPACDHCYAETLMKRTGRARWGDDAPRVVTSDDYWRTPLRWDAKAAEAGRPALVFAASLADVFEDRPDVVDARYRLWDLIEQTPNLIWLLLTKRPENVYRFAPDRWLGWPAGEMNGHTIREHKPEWPSNAWIGTTVEDQQHADERIPHLLRVPARVRFLSVEPMLGPVDLDPWLHVGLCTKCGTVGRMLEIRPGYRRGCSGGSCGYEAIPTPTVDWVICGGESGPGFRPIDPTWARDLRDQCAIAGVPFFFKQWSGLRPAGLGDLLDGRQHHAWPAAARREATP